MHWNETKESTHASQQGSTTQESIGMKQKHEPMDWRRAKELKRDVLINGGNLHPHLGTKNNNQYKLLNKAEPYTHASGQGKSIQNQAFN